MKRATRRLACERLESRCVLSAILGDDFQPVIVAGDPIGSPADSPGNRVDANSASSPFAGVGSLQIATTTGTYICTGTAVGTNQVLTAGHCVDFNNDGRSDWKDGILGITFNINVDVGTQISAASWRTHPDFTGFARPSVNDDLAVVTLNAPLPAGVPIYPLAASNMVAGTTHLVMVGYGQSGDGVSGYYVGPSFSVKRVGENKVDAFYAQDDRRRPAASEVFRYDFDGPNGNGPIGGPTLGNDLETTLGGGDSGGPSFVLTASANPDLASSYTLAGVNTFTQGTNAPLFGSLGGGINVFPYKDWILNGSGGGGGGGGKGKGNSGQVSGILFAMDVAESAVSQGGAESGLAPFVEPSSIVGATVDIGSPGAQSVTAANDQLDQHQTASIADLVAALRTTGKRGLVGTAMATNGIDGDAENSDDLAPAVDEVLSRWSA